MYLLARSFSGLVTDVPKMEIVTEKLLHYEVLHYEVKLKGSSAEDDASQMEEVQGERSMSLLWKNGTL